MPPSSDTTVVIAPPGIHNECPPHRVGWIATRSRTADSRRRPRSVEANPTMKIDAVIAPDLATRSVDDVELDAVHERVVVDGARVRGA